MKVLHVIRGMANSSGTTHIVGPLAVEQSRQGATVSIYCVEKRSGPPVLPDAELVDSRCFEPSLPLDNPGVSIQLAGALASNMDRFDVVHVHAVWNFPSWWAMRCAYRSKVPYVVGPQGSFDPWALRQNRFGKRLYGAITEVPYFRRASRMQALTAKEAEQIRAFGIDIRTEIIPNGIDGRLLERTPRPEPVRFGFTEGTRTLLFLSRIHPKKGLDMLIDAVARIRQRIPALRIVIAGDDAGSGYLQVMRDRCEQAGVQDIISFIGEVQGSEKLETLSACDGFILPSYSEGLPVAAIEAMGMGLPVITTDQCNVPEIAENDAGFVVGATTSEIANAIVELFAAPEVRRRAVGANARRLVRERFTWDGIAGRALDLYEAMVSEAA